MAQSKSKLCDRCNNLADIRYRIKYQEQKTWVMVCPECWSQVSQNNPYYRYGGTWKAKPRK
ncbi:hypothetical protein I4641_18745 [Waterburya agarophytonicola K14]|uniref:Uncharacterized protein n=1 Tax=Waterburya agarophytonicola KI4 TaxID=2874699 RepID=A0A964BT59_9CYAN|nr:hypothetical protein [Waterburya agarophytonicola]MCC0179010.1 hypothetical protein [Waterburya agarophytonicola KI4]